VKRNRGRMKVVCQTSPMCGERFSVPQPSLFNKKIISNLTLKITFFIKNYFFY